MSHRVTGRDVLQSLFFFLFLSILGLEFCLEQEICSLFCPCGSRRLRKSVERCSFSKWVDSEAQDTSHGVSKIITVKVCPVSATQTLNFVVGWSFGRLVSTELADSNNPLGKSFHLFWPQQSWIGANATIEKRIFHCQIKVSGCTNVRPKWTLVSLWFVSCC